jgi:hypothetical protein
MAQYLLIFKAFKKINIITIELLVLHGRIPQKKVDNKKTFDLNISFD